MDGSANEASRTHVFLVGQQDRREAGVVEATKPTAEGNITLNAVEGAQVGRGRSQGLRSAENEDVKLRGTIGSRFGEEAGTSNAVSLSAQKPWYPHRA